MSNHKKTPVSRIAVLNHDGPRTTCLYTDLIPLHEPGSLSVERASNIEFNGGLQQWEVVIGGKALFQHQSREECLSWEHGYFLSNQPEITPV